MRVLGMEWILKPQLYKGLLIILITCHRKSPNALELIRF